MIYALDDYHHFPQQPPHQPPRPRPAFDVEPTEGNANESNTKGQVAYQSPRLIQEAYPSWQEGPLIAYDGNAFINQEEEEELTRLSNLSSHPAILFHSMEEEEDVEGGYPELWSQMVQGSTVYTKDELETGIGIGFDFDRRLAGETEATPPLAWDLDMPAQSQSSSSSNPESQHVSTNVNVNASANVHPSTSVDDGSRAATATAAPSIELVAPRPMRLVNPAIHLAALVEEEEEDSTALGTSYWEEAHVVTEQIEEYMSDSSDSMDEDVEEFVPSSSIPPFPATDLSTAAKLDEWSFSPVVQIAPTESNSFDLSQASPYGAPYPSTYGVAPQWQQTTQASPQWSHPRTSQLQESLRSRRATRMAGNSHGRHASLPDVQYRPVKWNLPPPSEEGLQTRISGRHRETRSIDWSSFGLQNVPLPTQDVVYSQYPSMPYRRQSISYPYGMQ